MPDVPVDPTRAACDICVQLMGDVHTWETDEELNQDIRAAMEIAARTEDFNEEQVFAELRANYISQVKLR